MATQAREVVGAFPSADALEDAAQELMSRGFDRAKLSLLARREAAEASGIAWPNRTATFEDDPSAPRIAYMDHHDLALGQGAIIAGLIYVAGGLTTIIGFASGADWMTAILFGLIAGFLATAVGFLGARALARLTARKIDGELAGGGALLWVRTSKASDDVLAMEILSRHGARDVHRSGDRRSINIADATADPAPSIG
jgi:hypothetical protein